MCFSWLTNNNNKLQLRLCVLSRTDPRQNIKNKKIMTTTTN
jgi:hypothetical protein